MTRAMSLPAEIPHQETTPEKGIRVQGSASHGGYTMRPNVIEKRIMAELRGARTNVFLFIWSRTVSVGKLEKEIPFPEFVENISYGDRSIGDAILWLEENGWLTVRRKRPGANIYGIGDLENETNIVAGGNIRDTAQDTS